MSESASEHAVLTWLMIDAADAVENASSPQHLQLIRWSSSNFLFSSITTTAIHPSIIARPIIFTTTTVSLHVIASLTHTHIRERPFVGKLRDPSITAGQPSHRRPNSSTPSLSPPASAAGSHVEKRGCRLRLIELDATPRHQRLTASQRAGLAAASPSAVVQPRLLSVCLVLHGPHTRVLCGQLLGNKHTEFARGLTIAGRSSRRRNLCTPPSLPAQGTHTHTHTRAHAHTHPSLPASATCLGACA